MFESAWINEMELWKVGIVFIVDISLVSFVRLMIVIYWGAHVYIYFGAPRLYIYIYWRAPRDKRAKIYRDVTRLYRDAPKYIVT